jgi:polyisoprenoid-binding protein YceI
MKRIIALCLLNAIACIGFSQSIYITRNGQISFTSKTPLENIEGINNEVTSIIDASKGEIVFAVLIKSFRFEKALLEEHFNENYLESTKYPKATFQGKFTNASDINFSKDGTYKANVEGDLTIHGVKQHQQATGTITISKGKVSAISTFIIKVADYKIEIPSLVVDKIAKSIEIKVNCVYEPKS